MNVKDDTCAGLSEQPVDPSSLSQDAIGKSDTLQNGESCRLYHQSGADWAWCWEAFEQGDFVTLPGKQERSG